MKRWGWYEQKLYAHFDLPLSPEDARAYVESSATVARHAFYPFLSFDLTRRKFKRKGRKRIVVAKDRPIRMAAHLDGYIFAFYALKLGQAYERAVTGTSVHPSVIAYRRGLGSNVDFANAAFGEIERRGHCVAIALDIEGFFDNLDHGRLKVQWGRVLGVPRLPDDHYALFKAITRYAMVDRDACYDRLGIIDPKQAHKPLCDARTFRDLVKGRAGLPSLVQTNQNSFGVPQGSQVSALLSNIYMLPFDQAMCGLAARVDGYYRRYSDDILWIVPLQHEAAIIAETERALRDVGPQLRINHEKNMISRFRIGSAGLLECSPVPIQYLGFTFDGQRKLLRSSTLSRYWRNTLYAVRSLKRRAERATARGGDPRPFKRSLYRQQSHLGKRRTFLRYAYRAAAQMSARAIRRQIADHWERLLRELDKPSR